MSRRSRPSSKVSKSVVRLVFKSASLIFLSLIFLIPSSVEPETLSAVSADAPPSSEISTDLSQNIRPDPSLLSVSPSASETPIRILIPRLAINIDVVNSSLVQGYWELSDTSASHGSGTANPGDSGNIVIFAHAREGLFLPLRRIKQDDTIYIFTSSRWHAYQVHEIFEVTPDQVEIIHPSDTEVLTLFTCSGFSDSRRLVVKALPKI